MNSIELIRNDFDNVDDVFALGFGSMSKVEHMGKEDGEE